MTDRDNPSSILASSLAARANLRRARPVVPREVWELCNELWHTLSADAKNVELRDTRVQWLQRVIDEVQRINGVLQGTMRRDEALAFFQMGQNLERAEITCRVLAVRAESAVPGSNDDLYDEVHQMALLRSLASYQPFRRAMPARRDASWTLRFLLQDEAFPRAVFACLSELRDLVKSLPHNEPILAACTDTAVLVADAPVTEADIYGAAGFSGGATTCDSQSSRPHRGLVLRSSRDTVPPAVPPLGSDGAWDVAPRAGPIPPYDEQP